MLFGLFGYIKTNRNYYIVSDKKYLFIIEINIEALYILHLSKKLKYI